MANGDSGWSGRVRWANGYAYRPREVIVRGDVARVAAEAAGGSETEEDGEGAFRLLFPAGVDIPAMVADLRAAKRGTTLKTLRVDGGAAANDFLMQFQADLLGVPVDRPKVVETTALGAAFLAGLGVGLWSPRDLEPLRAADRVFRPRMKAAERERLQRGWRQAVERVRFEPEV